MYKYWGDTIQPVAERLFNNDTTKIGYMGKTPRFLPYIILKKSLSEKLNT